MNKTQALSLIDTTINDFQKFVVHTQQIYYKQDSSRALDIAANLQQFKLLIQKLKSEEVSNEHRGSGTGKLYSGSSGDKAGPFQYRNID